MNRSRRAFLEATVAAGLLGTAGCVEDGGTATPTGASDGKSTTTSRTSTTANTTTESTSTPTGSPGVWPRFQFDLGNTGFTPDVTGPARGVTERWRFEVPELAHVQPAVTEEQVFVPSRTALYALDRETGKQQWRFGLGETNPSTPVVAGKYVYVVSGNAAYKINAAEGWSAWEFNFTERYANLLSIAAKSPPVVVGNSVYVHVVMNKRSGSPGATSRVIALDVTSGNVQWQFETKRGAKAPPTTQAQAPAVVGGSVYFSTGHGKLKAGLYALKAGSGNKRWSTIYQGVGRGGPSVIDGTIYLADGFAFSVNASNGKIRWKKSLSPAPDARAMATTGDTAFFPAPLIQVAAEIPTLHAYKPDGRPRWTFEVDGKMGIPTADTDTVYIGNEIGNLYGLSADDGSVRWTHRISTGGRTTFSAPVVVNRELYVTALLRDGKGNNVSHVYALASS